MILSALSDYYDQLLADEKLPRPGWSICKVTHAVEIDQNGKLANIVSLADKEMQKEVPNQVKRTVGIAANFLCDNASYILGVDAKGNPERSLRCFETARELHCRILGSIDTPCAQAVRNFFQTWNPGAALSNEAVIRAGDDLLKGGNLLFCVSTPSGMAWPTQDPAIRQAWEAASEEESDAPEMTCLVTGEHGKIARLHPAIKGVFGAQSSGATLIGFNAPAFCSYGRDDRQGENAPVATHVARAYGAALNYLLSEAQHHVRLGDTAVVYWSEHHDEGNTAAMSFLLGGQRQGDELDAAGRDKLIDDVMHSLAKGTSVNEDIDLASPFYVLGLAPNAARLSVRFSCATRLETCSSTCRSTTRG